MAGGYLRDCLLGRSSTDLDFTLPGTVESVAAPALQLATARGTRPHLLGREPRAVWRIDTEGLTVELWPLGPLTIDDDILRRDFTCNALVWQLPDGPLLDQVGGLDDLRSGRLTAVSRGNLHDDPLRLLRAARFLAQLEFLELDHRTAAFIRELAPALARAPRARAGHELRLLLAARGARAGPPQPARARHLPARRPGRLRAGPGLDGGSRRRHRPPRRVAASPGPDPRSAMRASRRRSRCCCADGAARTTSARPSTHGRGTSARPRFRVSRLLERAIAGVGGDAAERRELIHLAGADFPVLLASAAAIVGGDPSSAPGWRRWWGQWRRQGALLTSPPALLPSDEIAARCGLDPGPGLGRLLRRLRLAQVRGEVRSAAGARRWLAKATREADPGEGEGRS